MMNRYFTILAVALSVAGLRPAAAQESGAAPMDHEGMTHHHGGMAHPMEAAASSDMAPDMDHGAMPGAASGMDHDALGSGATMPREDAMVEMSHEAGDVQGGSPPPDARDPHAYSDGYDFGPIPRPRLADEHNFGALLIDRLESVQSSDNVAAAYEVQGWLGRDYDRAVLRAEGEVDDGELHEAHTELLWGHALAAYWDTLLGVRHDSGVGPNRTWLAVGVQGLAPYWFEIDATAYLGEEGRTALCLEAEYELLLTQRLILQPAVEANFYGESDEERVLGSGLSEATAGLRLRYEIKRQFAPYVGVEWLGLFGETADFAEAADEPTDETRWVAGVRTWF